MKKYDFATKISPGRKEITPDQFNQLINYNKGLEKYLTHQIYLDYTSDSKRAIIYDAILTEHKEINKFLELNQPKEIIIKEVSKLKTLIK